MSEAKILLDTQLDAETVNADRNIAKYYANGVGVGHSLTDASIIFQLGRTPMLTVTLPFSAFKSLHEAIGKAIENIENGQGYPIKTMLELQAQWKVAKNS